MTTSPTTDAVRTLVPLLTDRARSSFELCDLTGLSLADLAAVAESEPVQSVLANLRRIARVRHDFLTAEADLIATGALLDLASATPNTASAADQSRKAAKDLRTKKSSPVADGGGGTRSVTEGGVQRTTPTHNHSPNPPPAPKGEPRASARAAPQEPTNKSSPVADGEGGTQSTTEGGITIRAMSVQPTPKPSPATDRGAGEGGTQSTTEGGFTRSTPPQPTQPQRAPSASEGMATRQPPPPTPTPPRNPHAPTQPRPRNQPPARPSAAQIIGNAGADRPP